jgi:dynein regulatory complex protein 1
MVISKSTWPKVLSFILISLGRLVQMRLQTDKTITGIKNDIDDIENRRREKEDKNKKDRANKIQNEVITSHKKNVEIDWNWQELEEKEDCSELHEVNPLF